MSMKPELDTLEDLVSGTPRERHIVKCILGYVVGHFYNNSTTYQPKENDNDYDRITWVYLGDSQWYRERNKYGDSGHA